MEPEPSLIIIIERARSAIKAALGNIIKATKLPAYLVEGILLDILAEVRAQKAVELATECENTLKQFSLSKQPDDESEAH